MRYSLRRGVVPTIRRRHQLECAPWHGPRAGRHPEVQSARDREFL